MFEHRFSQRQLLTFACLALILIASAAFAVIKLQTPPPRDTIVELPLVTNTGGAVAWP